MRKHAMEIQRENIREHLFTAFLVHAIHIIWLRRETSSVKITKLLIRFHVIAKAPWNSKRAILPQMIYAMSKVQKEFPCRIDGDLRPCRWARKANLLHHPYMGSKQKNAPFHGVIDSMKQSIRSVSKFSHRRRYIPREETFHAKNAIDLPSHLHSLDSEITKY